LTAGGIPESRITLLVATGNHRAATPGELVEIFGPEWPRRLKVVNHDCMAEEDMVYLGETPRGVPVYLNRVLVEAQVKVLTGLIAPTMPSVSVAAARA